MKLFTLFLALTFVFMNSNESTAQSLVEEGKEVFEKTEAEVEESAEKIAETSEESSEQIEELLEQEDKEVSKEVESKKEEAVNPLSNILIMELKDDAKVVIQLEPEVAPNHVARIRELTKEGFYNGIVFHRVIEGFMAQTGDPTGTGRGGSGQNIAAEFNDTRHVRGTLSMARAADPDSADSQFFIVFDEAPHLDGNYTVFGKVTEGMENIDKVKKGYGPNGMVNDPDNIVKMTVAEDLAVEELPSSVAKIVELENAKNENSEVAAPAVTEPSAEAEADKAVEEEKEAAE